MRLLRGRGSDPAADHAITADLAGWTAETGEPAVRLWQPHRSVAFGRRDTAHDGYNSAVRAARRRGYTPVERSVGGRAVAFTGSTVALVLTEPVETARTGIEARYDRVTDAVADALAGLGVALEPGEPADAFCPGSHSLSADGKVVGLAQRVRSAVAVVSGIVVVRDHEALADVLESVYGALGVPFEPDTLGSVARAGGPADPGAVIRALEATLTAEPTAELVRES